MSFNSTSFCCAFLGRWRLPTTSHLLSWSSAAVGVYRRGCPSVQGFWAMIRSVQSWPDTGSSDALALLAST
jgi:hypothetical protein